MADIMKCSRCGRAYRWKYTDEPRIIVGVFSPVYGTAKHELCGSCSNYLKAFMDGAKVDKNTFIKG